MEKTSNEKVIGTLLLFGVFDEKPILLLDNLVQIREFEVSHVLTEIDIDSHLLASELIVGIFDSKHRLIATGSTFENEVEPERIERLKIAKEEPDKLSHFQNLVHNMIFKKTDHSPKQVFSVCHQKHEKEEPSYSSNRFFNEIEAPLLELFCLGQQDRILNKLIPNTKWVRIMKYEQMVGIGVQVLQNKVHAVGLAIPVLSRARKTIEIDNHFTFFPQNINYPDGFGYYIVLQDAITGKPLSIS